MSTDPKNQLKPRPTFYGDSEALIQRLNEEIEELQQMMAEEFTHTADGQAIDLQISVRKEFLRQAETWLRGNGRW